MLSGFKLQDCRKYCHIHERKNYPLPLPLISSGGVQSSNCRQTKSKTFGTHMNHLEQLMFKKACAKPRHGMSYVTSAGRGW